MRISLLLASTHRPRRALTIAAVVASSLLAGACGGSVAPGAKGTTTPTPTGTASRATPATSKGSPNPATSEPSARPSVSAKPSAGSTAPGSSVVLDLKCARRGVDTQGITFQTRPGGPAGFNTQYSDGSSSVDGKSNYASGFGGGFADSSGRWRMTWTVPANAPPGIATVKAVTQDNFDLELKYTVVAQDGTCPA